MLRHFHVFHLQVMPRIHWFLRVTHRRVLSFFRSKYYVAKLTLHSLCYNSFVDIYYVGDTAMEPMFWCVDHFTKCFGPLFVTVVCLLTLFVVFVAHLIGIPYWWHKNPVSMVLLVILGYWLLLNIVFHYTMAAVLSPGYPPEDGLITEAVSICKKCISPKPPRTHHCSVCRRCILKMDHHCPWLNNCIGHYNHRHFFMFCVYMLMGISFLIIFGFEIFWDHFYSTDFVTEFEVNVNVTVTPKINEKSIENNEIATMLPKTVKGNVTRTFKRFNSALPWQNESWYHTLLTCVALLLCGVLLALGALTTWHARLIGNGETSIEAHINKAETIRLQKEGKVYINPYNFKPNDNWKLFLGLTNGRSWRHLLLPSTHKPDGNGLRWQTVSNYFDMEDPC